MELYHAMTCFIVYWQEFVRLNSSLPFVKVNSTPDWNLLLQMTPTAFSQAQDWYFWKSYGIIEAPGQRGTKRTRSRGPQGGAYCP